ncbi:hypothetical protein HDU86_000096 [Geranomyces michiganensis]|nr:hypothetical protein HDU86_000096 [Geranomyces michiganensis]
MTVRAASYSGVRVYEIQARGVPVMRRMADAYINATQILRAAGLPKPQRTKILERDVTGGVHEKVQGGYAGFQGTWIPLDSARLLARAHNVEQDVEELLSYEPKPGDSELPAKEKRKRAPKPPVAVQNATANAYALTGAGAAQQQAQKLTPSQQEVLQKVLAAGREQQQQQQLQQPLVSNLQVNGGMLPVAEKWTSSSSSHGISDGGMPSSSSDTEAHKDGSGSGSARKDQAIAMMNFQYPETPDARRTTKMSLRPPGSRTKRRPLYPGEDDDEAPNNNNSSNAAAHHPTPPSSAKKRRVVAENMASSSPGSHYHYHHHHHHGSSVHSSRSPSMGARDKTPPHAGKRCEGCNATSTPQWRRGPSGKRTLCNACGVKYSFGRLRPAGDTPEEDNGGDSTDSSSSDSSSDDMDLDVPARQYGTQPQYHQDLPSGPMESLLLAASYSWEQAKTENSNLVIPGLLQSTAAANTGAAAAAAPGGANLELEIKSLKRKLKESERGRKTLHKILVQTARHDFGVDDSLRAVLHKVAGPPSSSSSSYARPIAKPRSSSSSAFVYNTPRFDPMPSQLTESEDSEDDDVDEREYVVRFLRRVHDINRQEEYNVGLFNGGCSAQQSRGVRSSRGRWAH